MVDKGTISVIVPIYNVEQYVGRCVSSIISSSYDNLEIILVDDGSTDQSGRKCDEIAKNDDRVIVIHKENGGLVSARKAGVEVANGIFATFVDGDDIVDSDLFEKTMASLFWQKSDLLCYGYKRCDENGRTLEIVNNAIPDGIYGTSNVSSYSSKNGLGFIHSACTKIFKTMILKEAIKNVSDSVIKAEDLNLTLSYLSICDEICIDNTINGYRYIIRQTSITQRYDKKSIEHNNDFIRSSLLLKSSNITDGTKWNRLLYNEAFGLIMSNCVGCTLAHYGKYGIVPIICFFYKLANDETVGKFLNDGLSNNYFDGGREKFARLMVEKKFLQAFIMRLRKLVY
jgi:glycosyltransferase involved in cell wall biosynthesis